MVLDFYRKLTDMKTVGKVFDEMPEKKKKKKKEKECGFHGTLSYMGI